jgi:hypothetical protein
MATPGQLVETTAAILGIPKPTIALFDRVLAEHGLRSKGGRGRSAAKVNSRDAAHLLIAVIGSSMSGASTKDAARACKIYASLPILRRASWPENFAMFGLPALANLPKNHSLVDAFSTLIDAAARGEQFEIPPAYRKGIRPEEYDDVGGIGGPFFRVEFQGPRPWVQIIADVSSKTRRHSNMARLVFCDRAPRRREQGDLINEASLSFRTIRALSLLVKDS